MKKIITGTLLSALLLGAALSLTGCFGTGEDREETSDTGSLETEITQENAGTEISKDDYLAITEGGEPLYVIAYQSMNIPQGIEGMAVAGDIAKSANILASTLEGMLEGLDLRVVSDRKLSEYNKKVIALGNIEGISDSCYKTLRFFDYVVKENDGNIAVASYTDGVMRTALNAITGEAVVIDGELYLKKSSLDASYLYRYQIKELTVKEVPISKYVISCDKATSAAAVMLRDKLRNASGHILSIEENSSSEYAIELSKDESMAGYKIAMDGKKLRIAYASDLEWNLLWQYVVRIIDGVSMDSTFDLASVEKTQGSVTGGMIMSFNVLNVWDKNGTPGTRDDGAAAVVLEYSPDFIGLQEFDIGYRNASNGFISKISHKYAEVEIEGVEKNHIWNPIFYLKDKYTVVESGFVYFPDVTTSHESSNYYGGTSDNKARFRSIVWAVLMDEGGTKYLVANLHFSPVDEDINHPGESEVAIRTIKQVAERYEGCITLVTGDYNSRRNSSGGGVARMVAAGFTDTYELAATKTDLRTYHDVGSAPEKGYMDGAIDHVLTLNALTVSTYLILADNAVLQLSDHCPTIVQFTAQ